MAYNVRYAYLSQLVYDVTKDQEGNGTRYIDPTGGAGDAQGDATGDGWQQIPAQCRDAIECGDFARDADGGGVFAVAGKEGLA